VTSEDSTNSGDVEQNAILYTISNKNFPGVVLSHLQHSLNVSQDHCTGSPIAVLLTLDGQAGRSNSKRNRHVLLIGSSPYKQNIRGVLREIYTPITPISCLLRIKASISNSYIHGCRIQSRDCVGSNFGPHKGNNSGYSGVQAH
jgi:hypothetical protein